jgi:glycine/D-amino acid oxidase-like deaminating enzyme
MALRSRELWRKLEKEAGIVFPELSIAAFLAEAEKAGADLVMNERVVRWAQNHGKVQVHTAQNTYEYSRLLISAGAWTNRLLDLPPLIERSRGRSQRQ